LHYLPSETPRFAFVTGRVLGNAVIRNKIKRRMSDLVREQSANLSFPISGVFRMRIEALDCVWSDLEAATTKTIGRLEK
jgi:ribonuclease P protein component